MPRPRRYRLPGVPQHVIQRGNNRQATFFDEADYSKYLECLVQACERYGCAVHAYVLMTNHVHLLMTPDNPDGISKVVQSVGRKYVQYVNWAYRRTGTLWEGRYKASPVQSERYLMVCHRYIELNPVRARMVADPSGYRWSSHRRNAFGGKDDAVAPHPLYLALGATETARQTAYRVLFRVDIEEAELNAVRDSANQCRVLGTERFRDEIERALKIKATPRKRGRPRKSGRREERSAEDRV